MPTNVKFKTSTTALFGQESFTLKEVEDFCIAQKIVAVDTETSREFPRGKSIILIQIGNKDVQYVIDTRYVDISSIVWIFESEEITKVFHNAKFDINHIRANFNVIPRNCKCTMINEMVLTCGDERENTGYSLKYIGLKYLGVDIDKSEQGGFHKVLHNDFTEAQIAYAGADVENLLDIYEMQNKLIDEQKLREVVNLEQDYLNPLCDQEFNGIKLDPEKWSKIAVNVKQNVEKKIHILDKIVNDNRLLSMYNQPCLFGSDSGFRETRINYASSTQVMKIIKKLGVDVKNTGDTELAKFKKDYPFIKALLEYRKENKLYTTYGLGMLDNINKFTGRVHSSFWQIKSTGRISSNEPNLQNIPSKGEIGSLMRSCFVAEKGNRFVICDYSGQEIRLIAYGAKDKLWLDILNNGGDLHSEVAKMVFNCSDDELKIPQERYKGASYRYIAKTMNFSLAYGATEFKLASVLDIPVEEARQIIKAYFEAFPGIRAFLKRCGEYAVKYHRAYTFPPTYRRRLFPKAERAQQNIANNRATNKDYAALGEVEREGMNTPIQGTGADLVKRASVNIWNYIQKHKVPVKMVLTVHDEIITECPEEYALTWHEIQKNIMVETGKEFVKDIVRMEVSSVVSEYWIKE